MIVCMERTIVRCDKGGLYSSIWIPLVSFKAIRANGARIQWCPVHHRFQRTMPVDLSALTEAERTAAERVHDLPIP